MKQNPECIGKAALIFVDSVACPELLLAKLYQVARPSSGKDLGRRVSGLHWVGWDLAPSVAQSWGAGSL